MFSLTRAVVHVLSGVQEIHRRKYSEPTCRGPSCGTVMTEERKFCAGEVQRLLPLVTAVRGVAAPPRVSRRIWHEFLAAQRTDVTGPAILT